MAERQRAAGTRCVYQCARAFTRVGVYMCVSVRHDYGRDVLARPVGWFWGMERVFVGWKVHLSHSVAVLT